MAKRIFTQKELGIIRRQCKKLHPRDIANNFDTTEKRIRYIINYKFKLKLSELEGRTIYQKYTDSELKILANPNLTDYQKVKLLPNRTDGSVRRIRRRMGFKSKPVLFKRQQIFQGYSMYKKQI